MRQGSWKASRPDDEFGERSEQETATSGRNNADLTTEALAEALTAPMGEQQTLELADRDMEALLDAIANPPAPNDAMRRSFARWRERIAHK